MYALIAVCLFTGADKPAAPDKMVFVKQAILEGLKEDGFEPKLAAALLEQPDFVPKCMLCDQTRAALQEHSQLKQAPLVQKGFGLSPESARRLVSKDDAVRRAALRDLIDGYVERGFARYELNKDDKAALVAHIKAMEYRPKDGTFPNDMKFCPSCDGACRKKIKAGN